MRSRRVLIILTFGFDLCRCFQLGTCRHFDIDSAVFLVLILVFIFFVIYVNVFDLGGFYSFHILGIQSKLCEGLLRVFIDDAMHAEE